MTLFADFHGNLWRIKISQNSRQGIHKLFGFLEFVFENYPTGKYHRAIGYNNLSNFRSNCFIGIHTDGSLYAYLIPREYCLPWTSTTRKCATDYLTPLGKTMCITIVNLSMLIPKSIQGGNFRAVDM